MYLVVTNLFLAPLYLLGGIVSVALGLFPARSAANRAGVQLAEWLDRITNEYGPQLELEGRRRERRVRSQGAGLLLAEGIGAVQVEFLNVSAGGMQLFSTGAVHEGSAARIYGSYTNRICFVRYCKSAKGGYLIGIQFCGLDQEKAPPANSGS